ncbi:SOS response-associated peptidase family protein [Bordetella trematum]|uniref:SOS response-associated peptidase family protein n=1 Tax=Bordetella trematum TaxID=123899 RepID=UPI001E4364A3|nr:SOS response-associated peptidase family protein [Bordetella trematum]
MAGAEKLSTFNARDDRVANAFTFRNAWRRAQHCIIPADAIFEPDWRSGKAVATRFTWADGAPLGVAGPCPPPRRSVARKLHDADHQRGRRPAFPRLPPGGHGKTYGDNPSRGCIRRLAAY